jgi:Lectin C-type domain
MLTFVLLLLQLSGTTGQFIYVPLPSLGTWAAGRAACQSLGGDLASIHSAAENAAVWAIVSQRGGQAWIGGNDAVGEGTWRWSDGTPWDYSNWWPNQPDNAGNEDCVEMNDDLTPADPRWNDAPCSDISSGAVCRVHSPSPPPPSPSPPPPPSPPPAPPPMVCGPAMTCGAGTYSNSITQQCEIACGPSNGRRMDTEVPLDTAVDMQILGDRLRDVSSYLVEHPEVAASIKDEELRSRLKQLFGQPALA